MNNEIKKKKKMEREKENRNVNILPIARKCEEKKNENDQDLKFFISTYVLVKQQNFLSNFLDETSKYLHEHKVSKIFEFYITIQTKIKL